MPSWIERISTIFPAEIWCCKSASVLFDLAKSGLDVRLVGVGFAKDLNDQRFVPGRRNFTSHTVPNWSRSAFARL
jgi:hypothetical protein